MALGAGRLPGFAEAHLDLCADPLASYKNVMPHEAGCTVTSFLDSRAG